MKDWENRINLNLQASEERGRATTRNFAISIDGDIVWPVRGEDETFLEIQIDDLLAHLTDFWKPLMLRQVYPINVNPLRPSGLRREAERRWGELPGTIVAAEQEVVSHFEEAHDLSNAFAGIYGLPPFWLLRSRDEFILETSDALWRLPFAEVRRALVSAGDEICMLLAQTDLQRWSAAIAAWNSRNLGDQASLLAWSAGLDRILAQNLIEEGELEAPSDFEDAANDNDELRIAARIAGALPPDQIREIIRLARQFNPREAINLRRLSNSCIDYVAEHHVRARPFEQGEAAARYVREQLEIPDTNQPVQVFEIAANLGIELRHEHAEPSTLDGLAIWGCRHGPGVFLNEASSRILRSDEKHIVSSLGARVTIAHELCHLLLDSRHSLSAIEVLKARMPAGIEQRAKSFAGEFLLPTSTASRHWHNAGRPQNQAKLDILIQELGQTYLVTRSVAAWKVEHAARDHNVDL